MFRLRSCSLFCAGAWANFPLRTVQPELTQDFAKHHDAQLVRLRRVLHIDTMPSEVQVAASMPLTLGGLGIGNSERTRDAAHGGSWADSLEMIKIRHPDVARRVVQEMATKSSRCFQAVEEAASRLRVMGVDTPNREALSAGLRPEEGRRVKHRERDPTEPRHGWLEEVVWPLLSSSQRASVRSQSGPLASVPFTSFPTCRVTRMESGPFRVLLLRRLSVRSGVCGRRLDLFGQHRAACSRAGVLSRRGFAVESAVEQIWTSTSRAAIPMHGGWRSWPRDCPSSEVCSWHWMQLWCPPIMGTGHI